MTLRAARPGPRFAAAAFVSAALLAPASSAAAVARRGNVVMGTVLTVTVVADTEEAAARMAEEAVAEAVRWDDALTIWRDDGELFRFNGAAGSGPVPVSPRLARGLASMLDLASATGGAFEPATGAMPDGGGPRPVDGIAKVLEPGQGRAWLRAGARLDPGAIGKGLALDAIVELWRGNGIRSAFADFGGSSQAAIGVPPGDREGWIVLVAALARQSGHGLLRLRDTTLSTSRAGATDTRPILDPRSGRVVPGPRLATVRGPSAAATDAWSTAVVVDGREGLARARAADLEGLFEDSEGLARTPGMELLPLPDEGRPVEEGRGPGKK